MTDKKSAASMPPPIQAEEALESKAGSGISRPAPAGDPCWTQAWPGYSLEILKSFSFPSPPSVSSCPGAWRPKRVAPARAFPGPPPPLAGLGQWSTRWAPGCSGPLACSPSCAPDRPGSSKRWAPLVAALPSPRTGQGRGCGGQITAWNSR